MPPKRSVTIDLPKKIVRPTHQWTKYELDTLFAIMCRHVHTSGTDKPAGETSKDVLFGRHFTKGYKKPRRARKSIFKLTKNADGIPFPHVEVANALNRSLFGNNSFRDDIPVEEVSAMIDHQLTERAAAAAFIQRVKGGRITRAKKRVWDRALNFTGTIEERDWKNMKESERKFIEGNEKGIQALKDAGSKYVFADPYIVVREGGMDMNNDE